MLVIFFFLILSGKHYVAKCQLNSTHFWTVTKSKFFLAYLWVISIRSVYLRHQYLDIASDPIPVWVLKGKFLTIWTRSWKGRKHMREIKRIKHTLSVSVYIHEWIGTCEIHIYLAHFIYCVNLICVVMEWVLWMWKSLIVSTTRRAMWWMNTFSPFKAAICLHDFTCRLCKHRNLKTSI